MKSQTQTWRELMRCDDARLANIVTITIASMEFDVRLTHVEDPAGERRLPAPKPYVIEVDESDWHDLTEVLHELIAEQIEFDDYMTSRELMVGRSQRRLLIILAVVVSALAAAGAIEL